MVIYLKLLKEGTDNEMFYKMILATKLGISLEELELSLESAKSKNKNK